jgi:uncharacterized membrane protein
VSEASKDLGRLVAVYGIAPVYLQRVVFIVILSFLFFLAMMFVYYIRQNTIYFLLASAFLVLYLITLFSFVNQRRSIVKVYENGLSYKKRAVKWSEVASVHENGTIQVLDGKPIVLPKTLHESEKLFNLVRRKANVM